MSEVVISGISGRFAQSNNVEEFKENLMNKVYLIGDPDNRIKFKFPGLSNHYGLMRNIDKFDYTAFPRIPSFVANASDPQSRIMAEHVFEAIIDAGISPRSLSGSNTGVYVGCFNFDSFENWMSNTNYSNGLASVTNSGYSLANRISILFDLHGPSYLVDTACSSSMYALNHAFKDINNGVCDAAIVIGSNLILNPHLTKDLSKAQAIAMNGVSQPFDKNASGYVRSEACCVLFLQKSSSAFRAYATILNSCTNNDGFKREGSSTPSVKIQKELLKSTYEKIGLKQNEVDYIEAHATSTEVGDTTELQTIDEYFSEDRENPLIIGSVKGNTGHSEGASGVVSIIKSILMFENEILIPNININELRDCPGFENGRLKVPLEATNFDGRIIGVNNFGVLGANAHTVLKKNSKIKTNIETSKIPKLLLWSGRNEEAVNVIFDNILTKPIDNEFFGLLQSSQIESFPSFNSKGFAIFDNSENLSMCIDRQIIQGDKIDRPIVFVYSGVGSQWLEMGRDLMKIPLISESIQKCHDVLMKNDINLKSILTSKCPDIFHNCINIFVGIISIQIALTDLLHKIGIIPNFIIGHSVGEIGCAYADGNLTLEETILTAFSRGQATIEGIKEPGLMAAVAMSYEELQEILPHDIQIACHNSVESCTITGPMKSVEMFVKEIKMKKIPVKIVDTSNIPFHSKIIKNCGPLWTEKLRQIIKNPKQRSSKWISTSIKDESDNFSSIDYHVNNMLNPVRFAETMSKLPENSLLIEIAPSGLLQSILKQSIPNGKCISLTKRGAQDGVIHLLQSIGKIYQSGIDLDIRQLYPQIEYPVSRGTQMISPLIKWNHEESLSVPVYNPFKRCSKRNLKININDHMFSYIKGHQIDDRIIVPGTAYIFFVIETFALMHTKDPREFSVCIEDVKFMKPSFLSETEDFNFTVMIEGGCGEFEVIEKDETICRGRIRPATSDDKFVIESFETTEDKSNNLTKDDFYKELRLRGYQYKNEFQLVKEIQNFTENSERFGKIEWRDNFVCFVDSMIQPFFTNDDTRELKLPTKVRKILFNPLKHFEMIENQENCEKIKIDEKNEIIVFNLAIDDDMKVYRCGGIEVIDTELTVVNRKKTNANVILETYNFISHQPTPMLSLKNAAKFCIQLFLENNSSATFNIVEIDIDNKDEPFMKSISSAICETPLFSPSCYLLTQNQTLDEIEKVNIMNFDLKNLPTIGTIDILFISNFELLKDIGNVHMIENIEMLILKDEKQIPILPHNFKFVANITHETGSFLVFRKISQTKTHTNYNEISKLASDHQLIANIQMESEHIVVFREHSETESEKDLNSALNDFKQFAKIETENESFFVYKKFIGDFLETDFGFLIPRYNDKKVVPTLPDEFRVIANIQLESDNFIVFKKFDGEILENELESPMNFNSEDLELIANVELEFEQTLVYKRKTEKLKTNETVASQNEFKLFAKIKLESENLIVFRKQLQVKNNFDHSYGVLVHKNLSWTPKFPEEFKIIANIPSGTDNLIFFEKTQKSKFNGEVFEIPSNCNSFDWIEKLKILLENSHDILIHSRGEISGILGFFKCLKKEYEDKRLRCFIIEDENTPEFDVKNDFYRKQIELDLSINIYRNGKWGSYRHLKFNQENIQKYPSNHVFLHQLTKGDVSSLQWVTGDLNTNKNEDLIQIHYSALNFRDILIANSRISMDHTFSNRKSAQYQCGLEFSGITKDGKKVAGICESGSFSNYIKKSDESICLEMPESISLEEAATIPVVYSTLYFAFFIKTQIQSGKSILIHSGSGGLGQAAIRVSLAYGLEVFTTVGSQEKREFLLKQFPELKNENIGNSRDLSFERMIMKRTNKKGVDFVLNSLAEDKMQASLRCLAKEGTFFEVGKFDIHVGNNMQLKHFIKGIKYLYIDLSVNFFKENPELGRKLLTKIETDMESGIIKPINHTVFKVNEAEKAFRFMSSGKHIGKVLIQIRDSVETLPIAVKPRIYFDPNKSYVITGGLGGMGMEIADWMIMRNCMKIVLSSSRGIRNSYQSYRIKIWESYGVQVKVSTSDITTRSGCEELIKTANGLGPVGGIFNLAVVLRDEHFAKQNIENFEECFKPKSSSTKYLDEISRISCSELDHFVFFSSVSCGRGNGAQSNYGYSNSFAENIIEKRQRENLPGKVIQFGPIKDVGLLSEVASDLIGCFGFLFQDIKSCCEVLDEILLRNEPIFSSMICASKEKSMNNFDDLFSGLLARIGLTNDSSIDENQTLTNIGVDSISGVEIQQFFSREMGINMTLKELRSKTVKEAKELCLKIKKN